MDSSTVTIPQTLQEAIKMFADPEVAFKFAGDMRWPGGVVCPYCQCDRLSFIKADKRWHCKDCKKRFTVKVGTIMEDSPLKLETWMAAIFLIVNAKNGISSYEISRALGVTQKSSWFLLHRIRHMLAGGTIEKAKGPVEVDETFIGGLEKNKHSDKKIRKGRGGVGKTVVMGILERAVELEASKVRTNVVPSTDQQTLQGEIKENVQPGAKVFTDAHRGYTGLSSEYKHAWVDHAVKYVEGEVHTNGLENFWSLFQRMFGGTYTHMDPRHLQPYFDEQAFRFNNRKTNDGARFAIAVMAATGRRLTWQDLTERGLQFILPE